MGGLPGTGKVIIVTGIVLTIIGIIVTFGAKIPWLGRLPGDIYIKRDNFIFYFPIGTSIILSVIISLLFHLFFRK